MTDNKFSKPNKVEVLQVWKEKDKVKIATELTPDGAWFDVVAPCSVMYISKGDAMATLDESGKVCYCKMLKEGSPNQMEDTFKKPVYQKSFKPSNQYNPEPKSDEHYKNQVKVLNQYTLSEFEVMYNILSQNTWIIATQSFDSPMIKTDKDGKEILDKEGKIQRLYDFIIYMKVKPKAEEPQEGLPDY